MRFPIASLGLIIASFIFFVLWATTSFLIGKTNDVMSPLADKLGTGNYGNMLDMLPWAFGIICAIFFVSAIIFIFVLESLSDEPEYYDMNQYRR